MLTSGVASTLVSSTPDLGMSLKGPLCFDTSSALDFAARPATPRASAENKKGQGQPPKGPPAAESRQRQQTAEQTQSSHQQTAEQTQSSQQPQRQQTLSRAAAHQPNTLGLETPGVEPNLSWSGNRFADDPQYLTPTAGGTDLLDDALFTEAGKVHRHTWRGPLEEDAKEEKRRQDSQSWCGNRNPANNFETWPQLWATMEGIADLLAQERANDLDLQQLTQAFGENRPELLRRTPC